MACLERETRAQGARSVRFSKEERLKAGIGKWLKDPLLRICDEVKVNIHSHIC
jgi:hypothetical protein